MAWLRRLVAGLLALFRRPRLERELDEELRACLELSIDAKRRSGMTREDAIRAARVEMGGVEAVKDRTRDVGWETRIENLWRDVRYGVRTLRKSPAFTVVAVVTLALGIGANTALFTIVDQLLVRPLPVESPGQLVSVVSRGSFYGDSWTTGTPPRPDGSGLSYPMYETLRDRNDVFTGMFARYSWEGSVRLQNRADRALVELVTGSYFPVLGVNAALGRTILPSDAGAGAADVAVLSHRYWRTLGSDPQVVGRTLFIKNRALTIVGVAQGGFDGTDLGVGTQLFVPIRLTAITPVGLGRPRPLLEDSRVRWAMAFGRLRPGVSLEQARVALQPVYAARIASEVGEDGFARASAVEKTRYLQSTIAVRPADDGASPLRLQLGEPLWILMAIVGVVLLITCANLANLSLGRVATRARELALRRALGAGGRRLAQQLIVESVLIASVGGLIGLAMATWGASTLLAYVPNPGFTLTVAAAPDGRILAFTAVVAILTGLVFGLAPAIRGARSDVAPALKNEGGTVTGGGHGRLRHGFVVAQVALSVLLLAGAGLFVRSLSNLMRTHLGLDAGRTLSFKMDLPDGRRETLLTELRDRLMGTPEIADAGYSSAALLSNSAWGSVSTIEGRPADPDHRARSLNSFVSPGFFGTMGIPVLQGRDFDARDQRLSSGGAIDWHVAIANRTFVDRYLAGRAAIGTHIGLGDDPGTPTPIAIVGVVGDAKYRNVRDDIPPQLYFPFPEGTRGGNVSVYVRSAQDPASMLPTVRRVVRELDPVTPIFDLRTLDDQVSRSLSTDRLTANLASAFGSLATLLAMIGLYGVLAYSVTRRTREIGIRIALGAPTRSISWLVLREVLLVVGVGVALALPAIWALTRLVKSQLYGLTPMDPVAIVGAVALLTVVAIIAGSLPARRAAHVNPLFALRAE